MQKSSIRVILIIFFILLFFLIGIGSLFANESLDDIKTVYFRWPGSEFSWGYSQKDEPNWLDHEAGLVLFKNASLAWEACGIKIKFRGIDPKKVTPNDHINTVGFAKLSSRVRGLTLRQRLQGTFFIKEADIVINTENNDIRNNSTLLQKVVTHEFGHALGLNHSENCSDVMSSAAECGRRIANPPPLNPTANDLAQCALRYPLSLKFKEESATSNADLIN